jgi:hypothetical protein
MKTVRVRHSAFSFILLFLLILLGWNRVLSYSAC